jgi:hypothetical protein
VCCDHHQMVQPIKETQHFSCDCCTFLVDDLKLHHVSQHILSRMVMHQSCDNCIKLSGELDNAGGTYLFLKISQMVKPNIFCVIFTVNNSSSYVS